MAEGKINGQTLVSLTLKSQGLMHVFGIVGVPVLNLGYQLIDDGINYYGMRNEQAAGYAAGVFGYMTGRPGVCLTVPGPGMLNVMSGLGNALGLCSNFSNIFSCNTFATQSDISICL